MISLDLAVNAIVAGLLLGGFYAAVTVGVTISFGMLDITEEPIRAGRNYVFTHFLDRLLTVRRRIAGAV
jgi:hypothetical protein